MYSEIDRNNLNFRIKYDVSLHSERLIPLPNRLISIACIYVIKINFEQLSCSIHGCLVGARILIP